MNQKNVTMEKSMFLLLLFFVTLSVESYTQETKDLTRKERRELEKTKQAQLDSIYAIEIKQAIDNKTWVLEADRLANKRGESIIVNSTLNFIALEGEEAYVQFGSDSGFGPNGVGGVTVRANVTKYEVDHNKKGTYYIHIFLSSAVGSFDIRIDMNSTGQMASASVQGNTSSRLNYNGRVVPLDKSTVYKGTPLF